MFLRVITGLVVGLITLGAAWLGSFWWGGFVFLLLMVSAGEWARMARGPVPLFLLTFMIVFGLVLLKTWTLIPLVLLLPAIPLLYFQEPDRGLDAVWTVSGVIWLAFPAALLVFLRTEYGFDALLVLMLGTVLQDSLAYYSGYLFGGDTPFTPNLSPNKTWAGFFGGLFGMLLVVLAGGFYMNWPLLLTGGLGLLLGGVGQAGDLSISALKRQLELDDTGSIFPGHGGILDRVDALVFNVVLFYPFCELIERYDLSLFDFVVRNVPFS
jgi:phosphatidate cytidylyltransferase